MEYTIEDVQKYIESLGYYKEVVFVEKIEGDCIYFDAINPREIDVSIRADVENGISIDKWNIYECCEEWDWSHIDLIYNKK